MPIGADTFAYRRRLPHLVKDAKTYFVTFSTVERFVIPPPAREIVLQVCQREHGSKYWLHCVVIMPDHVHLLVAPFREVSLSQLLRSIKGASARYVNKAIGRSGALWQHESFDHILRNDESNQMKAQYIANNPVRSGLVANPADYRWLWSAYSIAG